MDWLCFCIHEQRHDFDYKAPERQRMYQAYYDLREVWPGDRRKQKELSIPMDLARNLLDAVEGARALLESQPKEQDGKSWGDYTLEALAECRTVMPT